MDARLGVEHPVPGVQKGVTELGRVLLAVARPPAASLIDAFERAVAIPDKKELLAGPELTRQQRRSLVGRQSRDWSHNLGIPISRRALRKATTGYMDAHSPRLRSRSTKSQASRFAAKVSKRSPVGVWNTNHSSGHFDALSPQNWLTPKAPRVWPGVVSIRFFPRPNEATARLKSPRLH